MSEVKVTNLSHPSSGSANITLAADGSVVLPAGFTGGIGSNVVQTAKTDTFTSTSTSFVDITGLSVTITPTSNTSKVLVIAQIAYSLQEINQAVHFRLTGGNIDNFVGDAAGSRPRGIFGGITRSDNSDDLILGTVAYVDSPAVATPVTYTVQGRRATNVSGTVAINRSVAEADNDAHTRGASSIIAIEVAA